MIRVRQVKVLYNENNIDNIIKKVAKKLNIKEEIIKNIKINKESIDARKKPDIYFIYEVDIEVLNEELILKKNKSNDILKVEEKEYEIKVTGNKLLEKRPIIVGSGPAGLFAAYYLSKLGYKPLIIERGEKIEDRVKSVEEFWNKGILNKNSNVQFGEGGAGTFSDGKLNTLVKDKEGRCKEVFKIFVENGADSNILYKNKPHIGTDVLRNVIINMRNKIIKMGGTFRFNTTLTNIKIEDNNIKSIILNNNEEVKTDILILAIGHSARDTFKMLYENNILMNPKPFAIGVRITHPQDMINKSQYGSVSIDAASYKLTYKASNNRGVYSFCMCPGGYVVNASSEEKRLAINGMSNHARDTKCANSAIVVTITPEDYGKSPMDGIEFQRKLEEKAYKLGSGFIPLQLFKDYKNNKISTEFGFDPCFKGNYKFADINKVFPEYINESLKEAIDYFNTKIDGFNRDDAVLAAIESRTSSPIRIERDELFNSNIKGIYPIGEGAGYAGGITTSAIDGLKVVEIIASIYKN